MEVWWDDALRAGEVFDESIERALRAARAVVVLWSPRSVASRWVRAEATIADRNETLIPCMIETCDRPVIFELTHTADLTHWDGQMDDPVWREFVADVHSLSSGKAAATPRSSPHSRSRSAGMRNKPLIALMEARSGPDESSFARDIVDEASANFERYAYALKVVEQPQQAQYRVETELRRSGDRARLALRLIDQGTGTQLLAKRIENEYADDFDAQEDLANQIVALVAQAVENNETAWALTQKPERLGAYHNLLVGLRSVREFSAEGLLRAQKVLEDAIAAAPLDPYLLSLGSLANSLLLLFRVVADREETAAVARDFMRRALVAGGDDPQVLGWATIGGVYSGGDLSHIETLIDRALERNPGWSFLWNFNAGVKLLKGDAQSALERVDKALELDGWSVDRWAMLSTRGGALAMLGRFEEALPASTEAVALMPTGITALGLVQSLVGLGRWEEAREAAHLLPEDLEIEIGYYRGEEYRVLLRNALQQLEEHRF